MSHPSEDSPPKMDLSSSRIIHVKTEILAAKRAENTNKEKPPPPPALSAVAERDADDEYWPLSGKPYFDAVFTRTHIKKYQLIVPAKLYPKLPAAHLPAIFTYRGKTWDLIYHGEKSIRKFDVQGWKKFVIDNNLAIGDACVFELTESSSSILKFKVLILRSDFPSEVLAKVEGVTAENPISIE